MLKPFYPFPRALCSAEDETGGDAGGEDTNAQDSTETNSGAATPQKQGEKLFTQAEVDALIVKAKRRVENKVRKETATPNQQAADTSGGADVLKELATIRAELQAEKADRAFAEALAGSGLTLSAKQRSVLRAQFDPENADAVVELAKEIFPAPAAPTTQQRRAPGSYTDPGAPNPQSPAERTSLLGMSGDDIRRLQAEGRFKDELEKFKSETFGQRSLFARRKKK